MAVNLRLPSPGRSLSARLLLLTMAFVLLGEVLIYVPSIARFRKAFLEERIAAAHLATLSLEAADGNGLSPALEEEILEHAGVLSVTLMKPRAELMLGDLIPVDRVFDLREATPVRLILHAFEALWYGGARTVRVIGRSPMEPVTLVDIRFREEPLWRAMVDYSGRILNLSIVLSLLVAVLLYISLQGMMVAPLRRITGSVMAFRRHPEDPGADLPGPARSDEIGVVQTELGRMQRDLRASLAQKTRLAALGAAVTRINHDLRNILASAIILSDRLEQSQDPQVKDVSPRIVEAMDRAARLCSETLSFSRAQAVVPRQTRFPLHDLVAEVAAATLDTGRGAIAIRNEVRPELIVHADRDQLYRVLMNLARNAREALPAEGGLIAVTAWEDGQAVQIEVSDTGGGVPQQIQGHLFEPFSGSTRSDGSGLGLAIAREIMRAHGGEIELARTGADGTTFRLTLPRRSG